MPLPASGSGQGNSDHAAGKSEQSHQSERPGLALPQNSSKTNWSEIKLPQKLKGKKKRDKIKSGSQPRKKTLEGIRQVGAPFSCRLAALQQGLLSHPALERLRDFVIHAISHPTASCILGGKPELITFAASPALAQGHQGEGLGFGTADKTNWGRGSICQEVRKAHTNVGMQHPEQRVLHPREKKS